MRGTAADVYAAAFRARCEMLRNRGRETVEEPGLSGVLPGGEDTEIRLLVTDDRAHDVLAGLLPNAPAGMIRIFATAGRCIQLAADELRWRSDTVTAMVHRSVQTVPDVTLPSNLALQRVQRAGEEGVPLADAVAAAMSAAPAVDGPPERFAAFLRSLPSTFRLFAAVDRGGNVRATSGSGVVGPYATVVFVNTAPEWRGRGIGQAMTAHALRAALSAGARQATVDASDAGRSIYVRLGFESVGAVTRFMSLS